MYERERYTVRLLPAAAVFRMDRQTARHKIAISIFEILRMYRTLLYNIKEFPFWKYCGFSC